MRTGDFSLERAVILVDLGSHFAPFLGGWRPIRFTYGKGPVFSRRFYRCVLERRLLCHYKARNRLGRANGELQTPVWLLRLPQHFCTGIDLDGQLQFAGRALRPPSPARAEWADIFAELSKAQWLKPEIRVRAQHLKAKGTLRHALLTALKPVGVTGLQGACPLAPP